ncbi:MAG: protein translocase subunit SecF [Candidatus Limnocylindrales bacterium]
MFDVIGKRRWFFLFSALLTLPGLVFILMTPITNGAVGLQFSIDYTGGTDWEIRFADPSVTADQVKAVLITQGVGDAEVLSTSDGYYEIRTKLAPLPSPPATASPSPSAGSSAGASPGSSGSPGPSASPSPSPALSPAPTPIPSSSSGSSPGPSPSSSFASVARPGPSASPSAAAGASALPGSSANPGASAPPTGSGSQIPTTGAFGEIATALQVALGPIASQRTLTTVGPVISQELTQQAVLLVILGSIGILAWMTFRFRDVKFGATALAALLHDVIVVVGTFAILGTFFRVEIDALFITAMLTVIGFSVHDTIVVYDRIRENKARHAGEPFEQIVNHSILQTFGRSINTSLTVVLTLSALLLFGGSAIRYFVLALLIGIISGTYSSIFNASPLLVVWQNWDDKKRGRTAAARPVRRSAS